MKLFNLHTHTRFSDGKAEPEVYVQEAIKLGFDTLGFSEHSPLPFLNAFSLKEQEATPYFKQIDELREKYKGQISILKSLEFDYIPGISDDFSVLKNRYDLDYTIGAVHLVKSDNDDQLWFIDGPRHETYDDGVEHLFGNNIKKAVHAYYTQVNMMLEEQTPDIVAHLDKIKMHNKNRYFKEDEKWYNQLVDETIDIIAAKECIVEVNTRGLYKKRSGSLFPGTEILKKLLNRNVSVTISSDAHLPEEISSYILETCYVLKDIGFRFVVVPGDRGWEKRKL